MTSGIEMLQRVGVRRILAAADVPTRQTYAKLVPRCPKSDALLAAVRSRRNLVNLAYMFAMFGA